METHLWDLPKDELRLQHQPFRYVRFGLCGTVLTHLSTANDNVVVGGPRLTGRDGASGKIGQEAWIAKYYAGKREDVCQSADSSSHYGE